MYGYVIVDTGAGPIDALKKAAELSEGIRMDLFLFALMLFGINVIGLLVLGVGILVTVPITGLAMTFVYRHVQPGPAEEPKSVEEAV